MDNDELGLETEHILALVQEQMADFAEFQKKQAAMTATASAADDTIEVTVDARGTVIKTVIDEAYLREFEFDELGDHITSAAQQAAHTVGQRIAALLAPLSERRKEFPSLSDIVEGAPDLSALVDQLIPDPTADSTVKSPEQEREDGWDEGPRGFPIVSG